MKTILGRVWFSFFNFRDKGDRFPRHV
jgi:hypothetical protein